MAVIDSIDEKYSTYIGVLVNANKTDYELQYSIVSHIKGSSQFIYSSEPLSLEAFCKQTKDQKGLPLVVWFNSAFIVQKSIAKTNEAIDYPNLFSQLLPGAKSEDYYCQIDADDNQLHCSIAKKEGVQAFVDLLNAKGFYCHTFYLSQGSLLKRLDVTSSVKIAETQGLWQPSLIYHKNTVSEKFEVSAIKNISEWIALQKINVSNNFNFLKENQANLYFRKKAKSVLLASVLLLFALSLVNFILENKYTNAAADSKDPLKQKLENLQNEISIKQAKNNSHADFITTQAHYIFQSVPNGIKLTDIHLFPIVQNKHIKDKITIDGKTDNTILINDFIKQLKEVAGFSAVELKELKTEQGLIYFTVYVNLKTAMS
jgi:hypothetical protein